MKSCLKNKRRTKWLAIWMDTVHYYLLQSLLSVLFSLHLYVGQKHRLLRLRPAWDDPQLLIPCCSHYTRGVLAWRGPASFAWAWVTPPTGTAPVWIVLKEPNQWLPASTRSCLSIMKPRRAETTYELPKTWSPDGNIYCFISVSF